jgi:hypothetical protein
MFSERSSVGRPEKQNFASLKLGGPMNPLAWFDTAPWPLGVIRVL